MKKILIYNWLPFDDPEGKGGGVSVYTKNLIRALIEKKGWQVYFVSSGRRYDIMRHSVYIEPAENSFGKDCRSFQIVNSPVLSSARINFPYVRMCRKKSKVKEVLKEFIRKAGGVDVVHFQNLEGLPLDVLSLKEEFPETRFIYSMHNYYLFCPQVMLWKADAYICRETDCGSCCIACMPEDVHRWKVIFNQWLSHRRQQGKCGFGFWIWMQKSAEAFCHIYDRKKGSVKGRKAIQLAADFRAFRRANVAYANRFLDAVLAVSERVGELAVSFGVIPDKVKVCYIGTAAASGQMCRSRYLYKGGILHLCYLGYARKEKGFSFMLDALEQMTDDVAANVQVTFATQVTDPQLKERILRLKKKLHDVVVYGGYTHDELPQILEGVHLGIVPPLWEDNLPQVAIEMKAHGIPVLCSHPGGAKELSRSEAFVFEAGNISDFTEKIKAFLREPNRLSHYWEGAPLLMTMEGHVEELLEKYYR